MRQRIQKGPVFAWRFMGPVPERLTMVPPDLRPADPLAARDFYEGRYSFAGRVVDTGGASPFSVDPPSVAWEDALNGFRWLRHMKGADSDLASTNARALVNDWITSQGRGVSGNAWKMSVTAARVIAWMQYSRLLLLDSDPVFYRRFMGSLARQVRYLRGLAASMSDDLDALTVRIALAYAAQVLPTSARFEASAAKNLEYQLRTQILPDGGHVSRCPDVLPGLLADLLPLAQCYVSASKPVPQELVRSLDRLYPALRFFRHVDGHMAMFHGAGSSNLNLAAAVLRHDQNGAQPLGHMPHSGYQRMARDGSVVIVDTGVPPSGLHGFEGHASCLAFEFSSGRQRLIVNSGVDTLLRERYRDMARVTAAHSTLVLEDTSSARFGSSSKPSGEKCLRIVSGPSTVRIERRENAGSPGFVARHDGYLRQFGLWHERAMALQEDGARIDGRDRLVRQGRGGGQAQRQFDIRFHLHPVVRATREDNRSVHLSTQQGESWLFTANDGDVTIEESIHFAGIAGPVKSHQIVIAGIWPDIEAVEWIFRKT
ncbi:heparinase II/III family protein [Oricola sp.]|uniref:heparinase II/III family protein n=1 Tax=Oricola sp. TaxID=1979950 RepID=UPI0025E674A7|nr:heparinase II/III family protein [Oricola sp.]MCI5075129.1 heparinase II/III family protein [Oricola sp.]